MAIALVANTGAGSSDSSNVTTSAIGTTGANLIVVGVAGYTSFAATLTDNKGNTWTALTARTGAVCRSVIWYCSNPTVGSGHTFSLTSGGGVPSLCVAAFSGAKATSPYEAESGSSIATGTSLQPGSLTPSENGELLVTELSLVFDETPTINSSFTITNHTTKDANHYSSTLAYRVQSTAAAINPTWSWAVDYFATCAMACFKAAPSGFYGRPYYDQISQSRV